MQEKTIFRTALIVLLVGLGSLLIYAEKVDLETIQTLDLSLQEEEIRMKGLVTKVSQQDQALFLEISGERIENTDVIAFTAEDLFLEEGDYIEIFGVSEEYQGKKEIIADQIIVRS